MIEETYHQLLSCQDLFEFYQNFIKSYFDILNYTLELPGVKFFNYDDFYLGGHLSGLKIEILKFFKNFLY